MHRINCPNCGEPNDINIAKAVDSEGEVFMCTKCKKTFRYAPNG